MCVCSYIAIYVCIGVHLYKQTIVISEKHLTTKQFNIYSYLYIVRLNLVNVVTHACRGLICDLLLSSLLCRVHKGIVQLYN